MKLLTPLFIFTLLLTKAYSQSQYINWNKNVKIRWTDFKGKAETHSPYAAMSAVGIHFKYNSVSNGKTYRIKFEINAKFDKTRSWSKRSLQTATMLAHEQLHFDISELASRGFKKEAEGKIYSKNFKNEINKLFDQYTGQLQKLQQKYDAQTMHSNNRIKQKEWENLIHQELVR